MEAYEVTFHDVNYISDQKAYAFAVSAASAIKKVCKKFKLSERSIIACTFLGKRVVS